MQEVCEHQAATGTEICSPNCERHRFGVFALVRAGRRGEDCAIERQGDLSLFGVCFFKGNLERGPTHVRRLQMLARRGPGKVFSAMFIFNTALPAGEEAEKLRAPCCLRSAAEAASTLRGTLRSRAGEKVAGHNHFVERTD